MVWYIDINIVSEFNLYLLRRMGGGRCKWNIRSAMKRRNSKCSSVKGVKVIKVFIKIDYYVSKYGKEHWKELGSSDNNLKIREKPGGEGGGG